MYDPEKIRGDDLSLVRDRLIAEQNFQIQDERLDVIRKFGEPPIDIRFHHETNRPMIHFEPVPKEFMKTESYRRAINAVREALPCKQIVYADCTPVNLEELLN